MQYNSIVISIGDELLLGKTLNSNLLYLGEELSKLGFPILRSLEVKDEPAEVARALEAAWREADVVICTGVLGPTQDDLSRQAFADFFGKKLEFDVALWDHIEKVFFRRRNAKIPQSNKAQAMVPEGFEPLENSRGTAPGLHYVNGGRHFFALQGVPNEMKHNFQTHVAPLLKEAFSDVEQFLIRDIHTFGIGESALAEIVDEKNLPEGVRLAWMPQMGREDLRIFGHDAAKLNLAQSYIESVAGQYIWGVDEESPAKALAAELKKRGWKISVAESCTGGLIQKYLSDLPGSSDYFFGGVVSYHNDAKIKLLGVSPKTLEEQGAVSQKVALKMAEGLAKLLPTEVQLSITGIAGPDGGSAEKPIGTVHYGIGIDGDFWHEERRFHGDRYGIRHRAAEAGILILLNVLRKDF